VIVVRSTTLAASIVWALTLALTACNLGRAVDRATRKTLAPGILASSDVPMACAVGATMAPTMMALGHGKAPGKSPRQAVTLTLVAAGMCAEMAAWEDELRGGQLRHSMTVGAPGPQTGPLIQDALIRERRHHVEVARRDLGAFERAVEAFGAPTEESACPSRLRRDEELIFLLGLTAGLLAVIHDVAAERALGVSQAIPRLVERGAGCLDNERWRGLPGALKAAVWASVPGAAPAGVDPWAALAAAAAAGEAEGLWLGRALEVQAAAAAGKEDLLRASITRHAAAARSAGAAELALLNDYGARMIQHFSDRLWMADKGHRTPAGALGTFPGAKEEDEDAALLDAIAAEAAESDAAAAPSP
jgi:hypothetical protein